MDLVNHTENRITKILVVILALSAALRLVASFALGNQVTSLPGTFDQISYHNLALRLLGGHGFTFGESWWPLTAANAPTAHWSFLYTFYLTVVYAIFGPHAVIARFIQAVVVGLLQPYLAFLIGKRIFNPTVGLLAAGLTAVYIYFIYYAANLMTEPFYITAILAGLYIAILLVDVQKGESRRALTLSIGLGLALGAAVLLRQLFLLVIPLIFLWMWWAGRKRETRAPKQAIPIAAVIILVLIIPFTIYNYQRFNRFVLLNTNAGFAFFWGNHPIYGTHFVPILTSDMGTYQDLIPEELHSLDEAALDQALLKRGIQFILDDPGRFVLLSLSRIPPYFMFWPSSDSGMVSNISRVASFGLFLPFMIYGLVLAVLQLPRNFGKASASPITLLLGFSLVYTGIHLTSWTLIRYRLPVDAVLIIFASQAIWDLDGRLGFRRNKAQELEIIRQP